MKMDLRSLKKSDLWPLDSDSGVPHQGKDFQGFRIFDAVDGKSTFTSEGKDPSRAENSKMLGDVGLLKIKLLADICDTPSFFV